MHKWNNNTLLRGVILALVGASLVTGSKVHAHTNGQPTTTINNIPTNVNQAFTGYSDPNFIVPQDLAPSTYPPNSRLTFNIVPENFGIPIDTVNQIKFRWVWDATQTNYTEGRQATHTFTTIGSHLVTLKGLIPGNPNYIELNTIQIDIVPSPQYKLPQAIITSNNQIIPGDKITFTSQTNVDPSSSVTTYRWKLDSSHYSDEKSPTFTYTNNSTFEYIYLQITDSKGFIATTNTTIYTKNNQSRAPAKSRSNSNVISIGLVTLGVIISLVVVNKKWPRK